MTPGGYGQMRATDADRGSVHSILQAAYADGRLTWDEFDQRSTALVQAKTYDDLGALTADLRVPVPYQPGPILPQGPARGTNSMAIASLACGVCQVFLWIIGGIA